MSGKPATINVPTDFSLVLGGPLYQLFLRGRLVRPPLQLLHRRILVLTLLCWLPLVPLTIMSHNAISGVSVPFLFDLDAHARFLVALPLLIVAEIFVHDRIRIILHALVERDVIASDERPRFQAILDSTMRLRNSVWIETFLILIVFTAGHWMWRHYGSMQIATWYSSPAAGQSELTPAGYWYAFVSIPIFQFLRYRWYFRFILWWRLLWKTAGLKLHLIATHPDRAGGVGFLGRSVYAFTVVLLAHTVLCAGIIGNHIWHEGARLASYKIEIVGAILLLLLIVLLPLTFFIPPLWRTKRLGLGEFGGFATRYVRDFNRKWIQGQNPENESPLGSGDIQSLADLANSNEVVNRMSLFPCSKEVILRAALILLIPFVPLIFTVIPVDRVIDKFFKMLI